MHVIGVIPVLIGPLQALLALLPAILIAVAGALVSLFKPRVMWHLLKLIWRFKVHIAAVVLVFAGARWAWSRFATGDVRRSGITAPVSEGVDWPLFRGDPQRQGARPLDATGPRAGRVNWSVEKTRVFYASPAVVGDRAYIVSVSGLSPFDKEGDGRFYCFDTETGSVLWSASPRFKTGSARYRATFSSPVIKDHYLVCGEGLHETKNCRIVCLDLTPGKEGQLLWSIETNDHVECTPVIAPVTFTDPQGNTVTEDRVFVGAGDKGGYYCLALADGAVRWHVKGDQYLDAETSLLVANNRVYAGLGNDGKAMVVLDAATGQEINRIRVPYPVFSPPALVEGKLIFGMGNGDFVYSATDLNLPKRGEIWCVDTEQLNTPGAAVEPLWKVTVDDTILGAIVVNGADAFAACADGTVYALNWRQDGRIRARWSAGDRIKASPAVSSDTMYVVTENGLLYGLDRHRFTPVWECRVGRVPLCISSPVIKDGRIMVGSATDGFVNAGQPGEKPVFVWAGHLGGAGHGGNVMAADYRQLGGLEWNYPTDWSGDRTNQWLVAPAAVNESRVFVPTAGPAGSELAAGIVCLPSRPAAGVTPTKPLWQFAASHPVHQSPVAVGEHLCLVADGKPGDDGRRLHALDANTGTSLWRHTIEPAASGVFAATTTGVFIQDRENELQALGLDGTPQWRIKLPGQLVRGPVADGPRLIITTAVPNKLLSVDRETGLTLWQVDLGARPNSWPVPYANRVYLATEDGLQVRRLVDGALLSRAEWPHDGQYLPASELTLLNDLLLYVTVKDEIVIRVAHDGRLVAEPISGALAGMPLLPGDDQVLYAAASGAIMKLSLSAIQRDGSAAKLKPVAWLPDMADLGVPMTPLITDGMHVYGVWPGWGLICMKSEK